MLYSRAGAKALALEAVAKRQKRAFENCILICCFFVKMREVRLWDDLKIYKRRCRVMISLVVIVSRRKT